MPEKSEEHSEHEEKIDLSDTSGDSLEEILGEIEIGTSPEVSSEGEAAESGPDLSVLTELMATNSHSDEEEPPQADPEPTEREPEVVEFTIPFDAYISEYPEVLIQAITGENTGLELIDENHPKTYKIVGDNPSFRVYYPLTGEGRLDVEIDVTDQSLDTEYNTANGNHFEFKTRDRGNWTEKAIPQNITELLVDGKIATIWLRKCPSWFNDKNHQYESCEDCLNHLKIVVEGPSD